MFRTEKTVGMLRAIAMIAGLAILLWSLGLPSLHFADAANITTVSDTLSDSAPSASSTHTIVFTSPTGVPNGATTTIDFPGFTVGSVDFTDIDVNDGSERSVAATCAAADEVSAQFTGTTLELVYCTGDGASLSAGGTTTIQIGTNADSGNANLVNPGAEGSVEISITAGADSGATRVVILDSVTVSASVDTIFEFAVDGTVAGTDINGVTSNIDSTTTTIPFGLLKAGAATTTAQQLSVTTNATNGYVVTVQVDGPLQSSTGADVDYFIDGSATNTPNAWTSPSATAGNEATYGHWGVTSDDTDTTRDAADEFGSGEFISLSTSPRVVMSHTGPALPSAGQGIGTTTVGYRAEISALQEAGDDYSTTLTYVATPTF